MSEENIHRFRTRRCWSICLASAILLPIALLSCRGSRFMAPPDDPNAIGTIGVGKHLVGLPNGAKITVDTTFHGSHENAILVVDFESGHVYFDSNSHFGPSKHWESAVNGADAIKLYQIKGIHKKTGPDPDEPWHESRYKIVSNDKNEKREVFQIGFEDGGGGDAAAVDWNDATAKITITFK